MISKEGKRKFCTYVDEWLRLSYEKFVVDVFERDRLLCG